MNAFDTIITLAIIIKIIDIFVIRHKKKIKERYEEPDTKSSNKIPVIIIIMIILIGIATTNQKETIPGAEQQVNANSQTPQANHPAGIYIQPLLSATTGIFNQMGQEMIKNAERVQQEARRNVSPNQPAHRNEIVRQNSEKAVMQARTETQGFDSVYKKPAECYDTRNSATRIKCANDYMRARAAFGKN